MKLLSWSAGACPGFTHALKWTKNCGQIGDSHPRNKHIENIPLNFERTDQKIWKHIFPKISCKFMLVWTSTHIPLALKLSQPNTS